MSTSERLEMATFEGLLEIHGSRIERWPDTAQEPLRRLLESSAQARARFEEAQRLDALLEALPEIEPAPDLLARITALPARHPRPAHRSFWPFGSSFAPLFAWGAAAALGMWIGLVAPELTESDLDVPGDVPAVDLAGSEDDAADDWTEVSGLALGADWASEDE